MSYVDLPTDLSIPVDDGACAHLVGRKMPAIRLALTHGDTVDLAELPAGRAVIFIFPMTGTPGVALPDGWDAIPGARGCTPQNCAIRDQYREFSARNVSVMALSTQPVGELREMSERLHLPYPVLSDANLAFAAALRLPTFEAGGRRRIRRLTLVLREGTIEHAIYPVFPPDRSAEAVLDWLGSN